MLESPCPCLICADDPAAGDGRILDTIRKHGWSALRIGGGAVEFAYTVGLWHTFRRPEIVMFGLDGEGMQHWLNACVALGRERGWPEPGEPFEGVLEGFATQLRPVDDSWRDALFGTAHRFYGGVAVPVQQLVWPDRDGRWPWDDRATASSRNRQAFAWLPVSAHPAGAWRLVGELEPGFPFPVGPDSWALTTRAVLDGVRPVARVSLDEGAYDVLDGRGYDADDLCLAFLGDLVIAYPDLAMCADLGEGQVAITGDDRVWLRAQLAEHERRESSRVWESAKPR
ncbi:DUF4262 domain-containing protein [Micromonospora sp. NBC_01796]|uniref:DUF4262 domain-containing protein n=1 Tax=Micromonospora sp. NBC_01796 TaxID=2975987 RepID=UPI002DD99458|nr:DUF4262 domain-containing protein [Micromonospora sp. NBC_01796]WSA89481.1 DUF4262 domain-containing protein [Micromonospora sp. NBC_01796]